MIAKGKHADLTEKSVEGKDCYDFTSFIATGIVDAYLQLT